MNAKQALSITLVVLGVMTASTSQMTEIFGVTTAKYIISIAGLLMSTLAGIQGVISSQGSLVKDVQAMPGIESIQVNKQANATLAALAIDPSTKVEIKPGAEQAVNATAVRG